MRIHFNTASCAAEHNTKMLRSASDGCLSVKMAALLSRYSYPSYQISELLHPARPRISATDLIHCDPLQTIVIPSLRLVLFGAVQLPSVHPSVVNRSATSAAVLIHEGGESGLHVDAGAEAATVSSGAGREHIGVVVAGGAQGAADGGGVSTAASAEAVVAIVVGAGGQASHAADWGQASTTARGGEALHGQGCNNSRRYDTHAYYSNS